jgi:hypothetical protein
MAQRTKTVEYVWETGTALRSTVTALAGTNFYTPAAITAFISETDGARTIRSAELIVTARDAETTTARRVDGCRIGIQVDAVAWSDLDLTGTGITGTGDPYAVTFVRDVTSYLVTNFTGASHSLGVRAEFETDVASNVNLITFKLRVTYEYNDTSATFTKTVRIPLEGLTGFLTTTANANFRGSTGAAQIPALDTFLPESNKTYRQIWVETTATDGGAAVTDFNMNYAIDGAATRTGGSIEQVLNGSAVYYDIWIPGAGYFTTNAAHDLQLWSSLASRFERCSATLCVTYTYDKPVSGAVLNSIILPLKANNLERVPGTATGDKERFVVELWVEEPATITLKQSALFLTYFSSGAGNLDVRVNAQGSTSSLYTTTSILHSGHHSVQHRIDAAHGGTAVTLARGLNTLTVDVFSSSTGSTGPSALSGYFLINYESGLDAGGEGAHNHTTIWKVWSTHEGAVIGDTYREIPTTNQRTPNIPESAAFFTGIGLDLKANFTGTGTGTFLQLLAEALSGEHDGDGWIGFANVPPTDGEFGMSWSLLTSNAGRAWDRWIADPEPRLNPETARKWRWNSSHTASWSMSLIVTYHAITFSATKDVSGSGGGTVHIDLFRSDTDALIVSASRVGNGAYTVTWYDDTIPVYAVAYEDATHTARSANFSLA